METERLIELLELLKVYLTRGRTRHQSGICKEITKLYENGSCSYTEYKALQRFIFKNKPNSFNQFKHFTYSPYWINDEYWWITIHRISETKQLRIQFLDELINSLK